MKIFLGKGLIVGTLLLLCVAQIQAAQIRKRQVAGPPGGPGGSPGGPDGPGSPGGLPGGPGGSNRPPPTSGSSESSISDTSGSSESTGMSAERNDLDIRGVLADLAKIPYLGKFLAGILNFSSEFIIWTDQLCNGLIARMLGGSLPCLISLEDGIICSGTSKDGGVYGVVRSFIYSIPSWIIPDIFKKAILSFIKDFINPFVDTLFGGLRKADQ